jgi:hypothetical protein
MTTMPDVREVNIRFLQEVVVVVVVAFAITMVFRITVSRLLLLPLLLLFPFLFPVCLLLRMDAQVTKNMGHKTGWLNEYVFRRYYS